MPDAQGGTVACFTVEELEGGRAFIDLDGEVIGLAPDGARTAIVGEAHTTVEGNLFVLPGGPESVVEFRS
jgi:hypothetical protein